MFNIFQTKPEPTKCICESLIGYFAKLSYSDCILLGTGFVLLNAILIYFLRGTPLMKWIEEGDRGQALNINNRMRTIGVQTTVTMNSGEIYNRQAANIKKAHCRDNGNHIQDFPNAENDTDIKNTKCEGTSINVTTSDENNSFTVNIENEQPKRFAKPVMKRVNTGASLSRIPISKHSQQDTENMWNTNAENEDPVTQTNKPEISQIPTLIKRSRSMVPAPKPLHIRQ